MGTKAGKEGIPLGLGSEQWTAVWPMDDIFSHNAYRCQANVFLPALIIHDSI